MDVDAHYEWPDSISSLSWPRDGIMYSYEHRGYIIPDKLECWLNRAFGVGKAKFVVRLLFLFLPPQPNSLFFSFFFFFFLERLARMGAGKGERKKKYLIFWVHVSPRAVV